MQCALCDHPGVVMVLPEPGSGTRVAFCVPHSADMTTCRHCGTGMLTTATPRYRLVYERPEHLAPSVWAFCSDACEWQASSRFPLAPS